MCRQKVNFVGKRAEVRLNASCANFEPSETFKTNPQAPRRIPLTRGKFALVDAKDYYRLSKFNWCINSNGCTFYAARCCAGRTVMMHRVIMKPPEHLFVDHIDHNGLNNTRSNLRLCTQAQNNCNTSSRMGNSKYKGVYWNRARKKWVAAIRFRGKTYDLGYFTDEIAAARAYDKKASQLHRQFACLNFPSEKECHPDRAIASGGIRRIARP